MKKKLLILWIVCTVIFPTMIGHAQGNQVKDTVVIGIDDTFVPMGFRDTGGKLVGFDIELAQAIFKRANMKAIFQTIDWSMKESELQEGNIDVIWNGYSITKERQEKVDFTNVYLQNKQVIITLSSSKVHNKNDLKGKSIGIQEGSSSLDAVNKEPQLVKSFKNGKLLLYENNDQALMDLEAGRLDVVVADETLARYYMAKRGQDKYRILDDNFGAENYAVGIKKGNHELAKIINMQLAKMKSDGSYNKIYEKWFGKKSLQEKPEKYYFLTLVKSLLSGVGVTLKVFLLTLLLSIPLGMFVALGKLSKLRIVRGIVETYILIMRGTPLLLQLIFIFFGLPLLGIVFDRFTTVMIAFTLNYGAYFGEIFRAGILSLDKGQYEAAEVLGFNKQQTFRRIILPQTIKRVLPPVSNEVITLVKDTSLVYVLGLDDMLRVAKIASNTQASLVPLVVSGVFYLILTAILTEVFKKLEKKYSYYR